MPAPTAADHPRIAEPSQGRPGLLDGRPPVVVRVVDQRDVHSVQAEPLQAFLDRPPNAVGAVVEDEPDRTGADVVRILASIEFLPIDVRVRRDRCLVPNEASDLGREDELVARSVAEGAAHPTFRGTVAVERCGVEGPDAEIPGMTDGGDRRVVVDCGKQAADRGTAEPETADAEARPSEPDSLAGVDGHGSSGGDVAQVDANDDRSVSSSPRSNGQNTEQPEQSCGCCHAGRTPARPSGSRKPIAGCLPSRSSRVAPAR